MFKLSIKKLVFTLFFLGAIAGIFFWKNLAICSAGWYFNKYCHDKFAASFHAEAIYFDEGTLVVDKPAILGDKPLKDGGVDFKAERLRIAVTPHFWDRKIDLDIAVSQPNLTLKQTSTDVRLLINDLFQPSSSYITFNSKIAVTEGAVEFHEFKQDPPVRQKLYFQLNGECMQQNKGSIIVSLDDPSLKNNCVILSLAEMDKNVFALDFNFDAVKCSTLLGAARNFIPSLQYLIAEEGTITGKMSLTVPEIDPPYAQGTLTLQDVAFSIPVVELKGVVKEAHLHLLASDGQTEAPPLTLGCLELTKEIALTFQKEGRHYCDINHLIGSINFETSECAKLNLEGQCTHHGQTSHLQIAGDANFGKIRGGESDLDLSIRLSSPRKQDTTARFITRTYESKQKYAQIELGHFGSWDFDLFKMIFTPYFSDLAHIEMKGGYLDVSVLASLQGFRIGDLKLEKIYAKDLNLSLNPWDLEMQISELTGELSVNLNAVDFLNTLNAELVISNGQARFSGNELKPCELSDLHTKLSIQKGIIEKSVVKGMFAGLNGTIDLDGTSSKKELIKFNFKGKPDEVLSMLPEKMGEKLKKEFSEDNLSVLASLYLAGNGVRVEGTLNVRGEKDRYGHTIEFGFELEKSSQQLGGQWPSHPSTSFWHQIGMEATIAATPALASPAAFFKAYWLKRELGVAGLVLNSGWFQAQNLPLQKYFEPFVFPEGNIKLQGLGDFQATFDHQSAIINYDLRNGAMENNDFSIEIKSLHTSKERDPILPLPGTIYLDFNNTEYYALLPIINGTFFEKSSGLLFTDFNSLAIIEGKKVHLTELSTFCNGMGIAGKMDIDLSSPVKEEYDVDIYAHTIHGTFSQLQHLFSHFENLKFFQKFPLEGNLNLLEKDAYLHMGFSPSGLKIKSNVKGFLTEGNATLSNADIELKGLHTKFEYDFEKHQLLFNDIHGNLLIGKEDLAEEYILAGDHFNFTDMEAKEADFDLWIGDHSRDIFRLVGKTAFNQSENSNEPLIDIFIDPDSTHFGNVHPTKFELVLKDWTQVQSFNMELGLQLETILYDLQLASRSGMFFLPPKLLTELNKLKTANGGLEVAIQYDDKTGITACHVKGEDVSIGTYSFKKCSLHGKKNGNIWAIDQLLLDDISLAADLVRMPTSWKANFIGLRVGESILVGMEGEYSDGDEAIDAKVNLLEVNLEMLNELPSMHPFMGKCNPKGIMRGTGTLHFEVNKDAARGWHVEALLNAAFRTLELKGLHFQDAINASCHYISDKGITFRQLKTALQEHKDGQVLGQLNIEKVEYDFTKSELTVDGFHFNVPSENLKYVSTLLNHTFPTGINKETAEIIGGLTQNGSLEGSLSMTRSPAATNFQMAFKEGCYYFKGREHDVNNFVLKYNLSDLKILTHYRFKNNVFWLSLNTSGPEFDRGVIVLSDYYPEQHLKANGQPSLSIHWQNDEQKGLVIHKAEGVFNGMNIQLHSNSETQTSKDAIYLEGRIAFDATKAAKLISEDLVKKALDWQMGDGYRLTGRWRIGKNQTEKFSSQIHFNGVLEGKDIALNGYQYETLSSEVIIQPHHIQFKQLKLADPAGTLQIEHGNIFETAEEEWMLKVPLVTISDFRPSLLREEGDLAEKVSQPLLIRNIELENLSGSLADARFLTGKGKMQFLNPTKKNLQNTIFAIPGEILTMLGLDLTVLNPVSGTIFYEIKEGRAYLTKFKDVYSEGKLSKFNLSHSNYPSFVAFNGIMQMQIKMKQYNLFFKLAELFTVNVGGTIFKPTYSLQKQASTKDVADQ
jgi:hypothetical protein